MEDASFLCGPLRLSMLLAAEGKHEAAKAMLERHQAEVRAHVRQSERRADDDGAKSD